MEIVQKKYSHTQTFTFNDGYLNYALKNKGGSSDFDIEYGELPQKSSVIIERNDWLQNVGYLFVTFSLVQFVYVFYTAGNFWQEGLWVLFGLACLIWSYFSKVSFTVFQLEFGNIYVIQDQRHDEIILEINNRKNKQLLDWYGDVNQENSLEDEICKFYYLVEYGLITQEQAEQKVAQAILMFANDFELPGEQIN